MAEELTAEQVRMLAQLRERLRALGSALVAFSGGVDSALLARLAREELGDRAAAVTARSETYPHFEYEEAVALAAQIGIRHVTVQTQELALPAFRHNPPDRCYHCKKELFGKLRQLAGEMGLKHLLDGANASDTGDFRPGMRAAAELGVVSPLKEAGLTKQDIRAVSRHLGLPTWDKPSYACLASRFPYGETITLEAVARVGKAEAFLRELGFMQLRVRHHGGTARIELPPADLPRAAAPGVRERIVRRLRELGYTYVSLDLQGYRTGSMNETLTPKERNGG